MRSSAELRIDFSSHTIVDKTCLITGNLHRYRRIWINNRHLTIWIHLIFFIWIHLACFLISKSVHLKKNCWSWAEAQERREGHLRHRRWQSPEGQIHFWQIMGENGWERDEKNVKNVFVNGENHGEFVSRTFCYLGCSFLFANIYYVSWKSTDIPLFFWAGERVYLQSTIVLLANP